MGDSPTTGEEYYSGDWKEVRDVIRVLNIGEGKLAKITEQLVEFYQEMVDREIDTELEQYYYTPLRGFRQVQPDGVTRTVFPGNIRRLARYWSAGLLLQSEFQGLEANTQEAAQAYIDDSRRMLFEVVRYNRRVPMAGQRMKHNLRTLPPTFAPARDPEPNF